MKLRMIFVLCLTVVFSLALTFAHGKNDTVKKASSKKMDCCVAGTKASDECTAAEKAHCDMAKESKITMKKTSGKMDCCKDKAKASEAKAETKTKTDAKGTN